MIDDFVQPPKKRPKINTPQTATPTPPQAVNEDFITPSQAAARDDIYDETIDLGSESPQPPKKSSRIKQWLSTRKEWFTGLNRWQKAAVIGIFIAIISALAFGIYRLAFYEAPKPAAPKTAAAIKAAPVSNTVASTLTGRQVPPAINKLPVTAIIVENSVDARPQSGLYDAGVVFEAIAEGGITRFLALYQDTSPESVGPIRSVRPYYLDWAQGFDAPIAHVGGSPEALAQIRSDGMKDLDQSFNSGSYERLRNKIAPHNVFTSIAKLNELEQRKNIGTSTYTGFVRKKDAASKTPNAKSITINTSSVKYNTSYSYDAATNSYLRNLAGAPHIDSANSKQLNPKVVVAMTVPYSIHSDRSHSVYKTVGSGSVTIFQDGIATVGTWSKTSKSSNITFADSAGKPLALNAGQTWISVISDSSKASYTP